MIAPSARRSRHRFALLLAGAGCFPLTGCSGGTDPSPHAASEIALTSPDLRTISRVGGNAVYQVRKESGASAYDPTNNTTYLTYNGPGMDIYVRAYDNAASAWGPLTLARKWTHYASQVRWSYHDYSTMVLGPDGELHIFQADHGEAMYEVVAPAPRSIAGPWTETLVSRDRTAYPSVNVVKNSIYLIYVKEFSNTPDTYRTLRFIKKDWNGSRWSGWSAPRTIIDTKRMMGAAPGVGDLYDEVYQQSVSLFDDKLWVTFHLAGGTASCPTRKSGHNCGAKDLYLVGLDVANPSAPGDLYSVAQRNLGATVDCRGLGDCPEFLGYGTGARVGNFPADPQSSDWNLSHPVSSSMAAWSNGTGTFLVAYDLGHLAGENSVKLARFSAGSWKHMTVDRGRGLGLRDLSMTQPGTIELAYVTGAPVKVRSRKVAYTGAWPAAVSTLYPDFAVPMTGDPKPDRVSFLQIVATHASRGQPLKLFGSTFNFDARQTDYTGAWTAFALLQP